MLALYVRSMDGVRQRLDVEVQRRADHIQRWQQERKRKVRPKMERAALMSKPREPRRNSAMQTFTYYDVLPTSHGEVAGRIQQRSKTSIWLI